MGLLCFVQHGAHVCRNVRQWFLATGKVTYSSMIRGNHLSTIVSLIAVFGGTMLYSTTKRLDAFYHFNGNVCAVTFHFIKGKFNKWHATLCGQL